jgi:uncharacterized protein YndB with AHSA1/START domain
MTDTASTTAQTRTLVIDREMPHSPEKIWRALTEGALMEEWLMTNDFKPVVGHRFTFRATPVPGWSGVIECEVLVVEPPSVLSYSWGTLGIGTAVTFTLTPTESGTHLRLEQSGFGPGQDQNYKGAKYGWTNFLGKLDHVVERLD